MPTIGAKVNKEELDAITEFANRRGVTISNLVRTVLLHEIASTDPEVHRSNCNEKEQEIDRMHKTLVRERSEERHTNTGIAEIAGNKENKTNLLDILTGGMSTDSHHIEGSQKSEAIKHELLGYAERIRSMIRELEAQKK